MSRFFSVIVLGTICSASLAADYPSADAALGAASPLMRSRRFAEAREPLEAAFQLAKPDDRAKRTAAEGLLVVYRELREADKLLETGDFLINTGERKAGRSLVSSSLAAFLHQNGMLDQGIKRYEERLQKQADNLAALGVLERIYTQTSRKDAAKAKEVGDKLRAVNIRLATDRAQKLQVQAQQDAKLAAWHLKDSAQAWLEAEDKAQAVASAKASRAAAPENRSQILTYQWHQALGDTFLEAGEAKLAVAEFEAAIQAAPSEPLKTPVQKKLEQAQGQLK